MGDGVRCTHRWRIVLGVPIDGGWCYHCFYFSHRLSIVELRLSFWPSTGCVVSCVVVKLCGAIEGTLNHFWSWTVWQSVISQEKIP